MFVAVGTVQNDDSVRMKFHRYPAWLILSYSDLNCQAISGKIWLISHILPDSPGAAALIDDVTVQDRMGNRIRVFLTQRYPAPVRSRAVIDFPTPVVHIFSRFSLTTGR
ncbi:hypothetical protein OOP60_005010 [Salmonella enterica]|uniref:hypothetical protein n=1 Tax=Salmonella enterica TaxID=28901 RepID=UPI00109C17B7|nr:hypothetical protein [Salmonella enterica]EDU9900441.1 hypothetical protein [Salmonella enterica subsp. diarizonae]EKB5404543.1 hypothetical protein [Salmonella enterica]KAA8692213.1 hypothetical protein F4V72_00405 [Salmonella enterica subsp. diarizonae]HAU3293889.1 hypothetical protein [Salmonella enterica subsp. diarizonae]